MTKRTNKRTFFTPGGVSVQTSWKSPFGRKLRCLPEGPTSSTRIVLLFQFHFQSFVTQKFNSVQGGKIMLWCSNSVLVPICWDSGTRKNKLIGFHNLFQPLHYEKIKDVCWGWNFTCFISFDSIFFLPPNRSPLLLF